MHGFEIPMQPSAGANPQDAVPVKEETLAHYHRNGDSG
jgi:hypothetical protein